MFHAQSRRGAFLTAGFLLTISTIALAGCSSSNSSSENGGKSGAQGQTLTVQAQSSQAALVKDFASVFAKTNPDVQVKITTVQQSAKQGSNLQVITSSNPPDVAFVPTNSNVYTSAVQAKALRPLTDVWKASNLEKRYGATNADSLKVDGVPYVVSFEQNLYNYVYYNTSLFKKAGITLPTDHRFSSLAELKSDVTKLKSIGKEGLAIGPSDGYQSSWMIDAYLQSTATQAQLKNYLTNWKTDTTVTAKYTDPAFVKAVGQIQAMGKDGVFPNGYLGMSVDQANSLFGQQRAGMLLGLNSTVGTLEKNGVSFKYDWALLPPVTPGVKMKPSTFNGDAYAIPAKAKHPALAEKFLEAVMSPAGQAFTLDPQFSEIPAVTDVPASAYKKLAPQTTSQLADAKANGTSQGWTSFVPGPIGQQGTDPLVQQMLSGRSSPQSIGQSVQDALTKYRAKH